MHMQIKYYYITKQLISVHSHPSAPGRRTTAPMPSHSTSWHPSAASLSRKHAPLIRAAKWSAVGRCSEVRLPGWPSARVLLSGPEDSLSERVSLWSGGVWGGGGGGHSGGCALLHSRALLAMLRLPAGGARIADVPSASAMYTINWSAVCSSTHAPLASSARTCATSARAARSAAAASSGGSGLFLVLGCDAQA